MGWLAKLTVFVILLIAFSRECLAQSGQDTCFFFDWFVLPNGHWEVGVAALYQQPCIESFAFANGQAVQGTSVANTTFYARSKFAWGWHLWGLWSFDQECSFAMLGYKHLCSLAKPHPAINNGFALFTIANL